MELSQIPVTMLKGVGSKLAEKLQHLRLHTVQDLLFVITSYSIHYTKLYDAIMLITVAILVILVQVIQSVGDRLVKKFDHR